MEHNKIYIVQLHTNTIPSKIIKLATKYKYSHIAISFTKDCDITYSFGRKKVNNIFDAGFIKEKKTGEFFKKFNKTICRIYEIDITNEQLQQLKEIICNIEENEKQYKYDFIGIVLRFFKIPISFKNRYVCSFFVAKVLEKASIYKFEKEDYLVEPKDFENIAGSKEIYEGYFSKIS